MPLQIIWDPIMKNAEIVIMLFIFVWIFSWAKQNLGSAKLAVLFALIAVFLTFYQFPILIWMLVGLFLLATFGKEVVGRVNPYRPETGLH